MYFSHGRSSYHNNCKFSDFPFTTPVKFQFLLFTFRALQKFTSLLACSCSPQLLCQRCQSSGSFISSPNTPCPPGCSLHTHSNFLISVPQAVRPSCSTQKAVSHHLHHMQDKLSNLHSYSSSMFRGTVSSQHFQNLTSHFTAVHISSSNTRMTINRVKPNTFIHAHMHRGDIQSHF